MSDCMYCGFKHPLETEFELLAHDQKPDIDPDDAEDWHSLAVGFAAAKGASAQDCRHFGDHVVKHTELT